MPVRLLARAQKTLFVVRDHINRWSPGAHVTLLLVFYLLAASGVMARYEWNPSSLVRFGHYYVEQNPEATPPGAVRLIGNEAHGGNGYDGQIFYYYAYMLFEPDAWPEGFSRAYRAPRVGYPLIAVAGAAPVWPVLLPFLENADAAWAWAVVYGLILTQLLAMAAALLALRSMLAPEQRYLCVFYALSPFALLAFLLLVSDALAISFALLGFYFFRRSFGWPLSGMPADGLAPIFASNAPERKTDWKMNPLANGFAAWACMSLAILSKESALFFLFPLGLAALFPALRLRFGPALLVLSALAAPAAWQLYLRAVHGMVPAGILAIFLEPLDGVRGMLAETAALLAAFIDAPGAGAMLELAKHGAKLLLFATLLAAILIPLQNLRGMFSRHATDRNAQPADSTGNSAADSAENPAPKSANPRPEVLAWLEKRLRPLALLAPFRLGVWLTSLSILIADYYYFWSVFDNVARMFAMIAPMLILLKASAPRIKAWPAFALILVLAAFALGRSLALTPQFPHDSYSGPYAGPEYSLDAPGPRAGDQER